MTRTEKKVLEYAHKYITKANPFNKSLHVSLIFHKGFPLVYGLNNESPSDTPIYINGSIHSEWDVIRKYKRKFLLGQIEECDLYNVRIRRDRSIANYKPCIRCRKLLRRFCFRRVYYSIDENNFLEYVNEEK